METNDKVFIDSVELSDCGPKGLVILTDKNTGKVIFKKHNLVVAQGRQYIFSLFAKSNYASSEAGNSPNFVFTDSEYDELSNGSGTSIGTLAGKKLSYLEFGIGTNDVSLSDTSITPVTVQDNGGNFVHPLRFKIIPNSANQPAGEEKFVKALLIENEGRHYLKFEFNFEGKVLDGVADGNKHLISELGLFLLNANSTNLDDSSALLFSRIRFDTIPITSESSLLLQYYVYF